MSDKAYRRRDLEAPPPGSLFALVDPPRASARQRTRWATQDEAFASRDGTQAATILASIREAPATCDEIEQRLGMTHQSASAAINQLMRAGAIVANGSRKTRSGRSARVWEAT
jgi:predicted Rossmann fold nucleotide-binding protein DprA/Smf involved in DNA uptake